MFRNYEDHIQNRFEHSYCVGLIPHAEGHGHEVRPRSKFNKTRIAYYAGHGLPTFQLSKNESVLVMSGDVKKNPK